MVVGHFQLSRANAGGESPNSQPTLSAIQFAEGTRTPELPRPDNAVKGQTGIPRPKRHYYAGLSRLRSLRWGYYEFEDLDLLQDTARAPASMWGIRVGGRYPISSIFRAQVGLQMNFGSIIVDTLLDRYLMPVAEEYSVRHFGVFPEIQIMLPPVGVTQLHAALGIGFNTVKYSEPEDRKLTGLTDRRWCIGAHGGVGFDIWASESFGLTLSYSQTIWRPVYYSYKIELPEYSLPYWEIHWTHTVGAALIFMIND